MTKLRPIPTADQPWFGPDGKPRVYEYLFDLDKAARGAESSSDGVPASRKVQTGNGLTGGGDLSADRTISVLFGTVAGTVAAGNDSRIVGAAQTSLLGSAAYASTGDFDAIGAASSAIAAHIAASDPHPQYLTASEGNAAYQPLDSDLTAIAALATTSYGRALLTLANGAALKALLTINAADIADASANGRSFITAANYAAMKSLLSLAKSDVGLSNVDNVSVAGAWSTWTPTISSGTGSVTGATIATVAKYKANGKTVHWKVQCTLTNVGSGSPGDAVKFTTPPGLTPLDSYNPAAAFYVNGAVNAGGFISSTGNVFAFKADGTTLWANGNVFVIGGTYEAA